MIDKIIDYVDGHALWLSDFYPYETFIGYEEDGVVILYDYLLYNN